MKSLRWKCILCNSVSGRWQGVSLNPRGSSLQRLRCLCWAPSPLWGGRLSLRRPVREGFVVAWGQVRKSIERALAWSQTWMFWSSDVMWCPGNNSYYTSGSRRQVNHRHETHFFTPYNLANYKMKMAIKLTPRGTLFLSRAQEGWCGTADSHRKPPKEQLKNVSENVLHTGETLGTL